MDENVRVNYVRLTNGLDVPFSDRHDGVPLVLEPGETQNLHAEMAAHFFGYNPGASAEGMFRHTCKRQGWNTIEHLKKDESGKTLAERNFAALKIEPVVYKLVEEAKIDTEAPIPADPIPPLPPAPEGLLPSLSTINQAVGRDKSSQSQGGRRPGAV